MKTIRFCLADQAIEQPVVDAVVRAATAPWELIPRACVSGRVWAILT
jgi:hypothetical protein